MSTIDQEYLRRMDALTPQERVARSVAMLKWSRDLIGRQILAELPDCPFEELKWRVALRLYGSDPIARATIERILLRVSSRSI